MDNVTVEELKRKIRWYKKNVYGVDLKYPKDYQAELYKLTGRFSLKDTDIRALEAMGFVFEEVLE